MIAAALLVAAPMAAQEQRSIATGGTAGVYYPIGGGLAEIINRHVPGYTATAAIPDALRP
jgi:TRAP-type uncharacterized transport system substrate-binding protein